MTTVRSESAALHQLLEHPRLWRIRDDSFNRSATLSSGFAELDARLPGGGWPARGLVELLVEHAGIGELSLVMPPLAQCLESDPAAWLAWIAPPHEPYAPALMAHGVDPDRVLVVRTSQATWAMEQTLRSSACAAVLGWVDTSDLRSLRRLKLATEKSGALSFMFRSTCQRMQPSPAELRLVLAPARSGLEIELLKSRGSTAARIVLPMTLGRVC